MNNLQQPFCCMRACGCHSNPSLLGDAATVVPGPGIACVPDPARTSSAFDKLKCELPACASEVTSMLTAIVISRGRHFHTPATAIMEMFPS